MEIFLGIGVAIVLLVAFIIKLIDNELGEQKMDEYYLAHEKLIEEDWRLHYEAIEKEKDS